MIVFDHHFRKLAVPEPESDAPWQPYCNAPAPSPVASEFVKPDVWGFALYPQIVEGRGCVHDRQQCFCTEPEVSGQCPGLIGGPDIPGNPASKTGNHVIPSLGIV